MDRCRPHAVDPRSITVVGLRKRRPEVGILSGATKSLQIISFSRSKLTRTQKFLPAFSPERSSRRDGGGFHRGVVRRPESAFATDGCGTRVLP